MRKSHIFFKLILPKKHPSTFTNTLMAYSHFKVLVICYVMKMCICYMECVRETSRLHMVSLIP